MLEQATIRTTTTDYRGQAVDLYIVAKGEIMILANGRASGLVADNYKKATLQEAMDSLTVDKVSALIEYNRALCTVYLDVHGAYTIWSDGQCLFSN